MVEIRNLVKNYGKLRALDGLNLSIKRGEIFGFLGPNGSGKTTAMNCMLALLSYDSGSVKIFGKDMKPNSYDIKKKIGVVPQNVAVFKDFSVRENIDYFCGLYVQNRRRRRELVDEAIEFAELQDFVKFRPQKLSGGLLRRLNLVCGIAHKPKLIILDEPTVAVDPQSRNKILEGIQELNKNGSTVIYTTHYMEEVEEICTKVVIMDHGKILAQGTTEELKQQVSLEHVLSKLPSLNEVFLEITGKELRD
ncbi:MAG: ABC transporter ATP-binding protein [Blautia sp.]